MKLFRHNGIQNLLVIVCGVAFLNLSFILAEVQFISFLKGNPYIENITTNGLEEENETDESNEKESSLKEVAISAQHHSTYYNHLVVTSQKSCLNHYYAALANGHKKIFSPPPEA